MAPWTHRPRYSEWTSSSTRDLRVTRGHSTGPVQVSPGGRVDAPRSFTLESYGRSGGLSRTGEGSGLLVLKGCGFGPSSPRHPWVSGPPRRTPPTCERRHKTFVPVKTR